MTCPTLEVVSEDAGLYAVAREENLTIGVIGPMDDRDALMSAAVDRWPTIDHIDLPSLREDGEPLTGHDDIDYPPDIAHPGNAEQEQRGDA